MVMEDQDLLRTTAQQEGGPTSESNIDNGDERSEPILQQQVPSSPTFLPPPAIHPSKHYAEAVAIVNQMQLPRGVDYMATVQTVLAGIKEEEREAYQRQQEAYQRQQEALQRQQEAYERQQEAQRIHEERQQEAQRNHELALKRTADATVAAQSQQRSSTPAPRPLVPPIVPFNPDLERADAFLRRFVAHCTRHNVNQEDLVDLFLPLISQKDSLIVYGLEAELRYDWDHVSKIFLKQHAVTESQKRKDYLESQPESHDTATTYVKSLERRYKEWLLAAEVPETYDGLFQFHIKDHLLHQLPAI